MSHRSQKGTRCSCWRILHSPFIFAKVSWTQLYSWMGGPDRETVPVRSLGPRSMLFGPGYLIFSQKLYNPEYHGSGRMVELGTNLCATD